ncbi:MAG TPA: ABC transporter substrate-binding protein [Solirubrobacterales bacterium]|nr:ABC transporter substrate-binding protein [Solirubrobacterales bacterium]
MTTVQALPPQRQDRAMWVAMDGWDTAETIAFPMAEERDYFTKAQLAITTLSPTSPKLSIPDVVKGQDSVGVAHGPEVVLARDRGAPIVIVSSFVPHPTAALIWPQESGIGGVADLKGKTIAIPGLPFQKDFLEIALAQGGLTLDDVKVRSVDNDLVPSLVSGHADAIFGGSGNVEGAALRSHGLEPVVKPVQTFGIPDYEELVLVAREDWAAENPQTVRDLVSALAKGSTAAVSNPAEAIKAMEADGERNPAVSPQARAVEVRQTLPLLSQGARVSAARLQSLIDWLNEEEMIKKKPSVDELIVEPEG